MRFFGRRALALSSVGRSIRYFGGISTVADINQSREDLAKDIGTWGTSSCNNQKRESFIV